MTAPTNRTTRRRRRFQFSLASLGLLITGFCVCLAWLAHERGIVRKRREAIQAIELLGGGIQFDTKRPFRDGWLRRLLGDDTPGAVVAVDIPFSNALSDEVIHHLAGLVEVEQLAIEKLPFLSDADLAKLGGLRKLKVLRIANASVESSGLAHLANLKQLESLDFDRLILDREDLGFLAGLTNLRTLRITDSRLRSPDLSVLVNLPSLTELVLTSDFLEKIELRGLASLEVLTVDSGMAYSDPPDFIVKDAPALEKLNLEGPFGAICLKSLPNLVDLKLDIYDSRRNEGSLDVEICDVPRVKRLVIDSAGSVRLQHFDATGLEQLSLRHAIVTADSAADLPELVELEVSGSRLESHVASPLGPLPKLKRLRLSNYTPAAVHSDLSKFGELASLQELTIEGGDMGMTDLRPLRLARELRKLRLVQVSLAAGGEQTDSIPVLPNLRSLVLENVNLSPGQLRALAAQPGVERLKLKVPITDDDLAALREHPSLQCLKLPAASISDAGLLHLHGLKELVYVDVYLSGATAAGVAELSATLPRDHCLVYGRPKTWFAQIFSQESGPRNLIRGEPSVEAFLEDEDWLEPLR